MKKVYSIFALLFFFTIGGFSQYRCIPSVQEHGNPGMGMGDPFVEDFQHYGFYFSTNPPNVVTWQAVRQIGFPFYFNGALVTAFKTADNGVLTFDTASSPVPPSNSLLLPNANIPNRSICIRGGRPANGYTNVVVTQTINYNLPLPSKQLWISFICLVDSGSIHKQLWSIVLEENTNNIYVVNQWREKNIPDPMVFTIGIQVNSTTAYLAPGSPFIHGEAGEGGGSSDNYYYAFLPGSSIVADGSVTASNLGSYLSVARGPYTVKAKFRNLGKDTITGLTMHYKINGGAAISQSFTGLKVPSGFSKWLTFTNPFAPSVPGSYQLEYWCDNLSTGNDGDTTNNHFSQVVNVAQALPLRHALMEEFKGTWCNSSGYWTQKYDALLKRNERFASNIHYEESNVNWTYDRNQISDRQRSLFRCNYIPISVANGNVIDGIDRESTASNYYGCPWNLTQPLIDSLILLNGLFFIHPYLTVVQDSILHISVAATAATTLAANTNCRLYTALVEDTLISATNFYPGSSNEKILVNTVRIMFPSYSSGIHQVSQSTPDTGIFIGHPVIGHTDSFNYTYIISDTSCKTSRLHVVAFIQDTLTNEIYQSAQSDMPFIGLEPRADFSGISPLRICAGNQVNFQNESLLGTSYKWLFPGGVPASNTATNPPAITYPGPGKYDVTLIATNLYGSDTFTFNQYITVMDTTVSTVSANFEGSNLLPDKWWFLPHGLTWFVDSNASGYGIGKRCLVSDINYDSVQRYRECNLVLPQLNFRYVSHPTLKYDYSFLASSFPPAYLYNDTLLILVSKDCGASYDTVYRAGKDSLRTEGLNYPAYYPDSTQWKTRHIDLSAYSNENSIQIVFRLGLYPLAQRPVRLDNIQVSNTVLPPAANFSASNQQICKGTSVIFQNSTLDATDYQWIFSGGTPPTSTLVNPPVVYNSSGAWPVTLIAINGNYSDTIVKNTYITVTPPLESPITNDTTKCNNVPLVLNAGSGFDAYQWSTGDSMQTITVNNAGTYFLITTDANGCDNIDTIVVHTTICTGFGEYPNELAIKVYPNPTNEFVIFKVPHTMIGLQLILKDVAGSTLFNKQVENTEFRISLAQMPQGIYYFEVGNDKIWHDRIKVVKQ